MIIKINKNNSVLINTTDFELFETNTFGNSSIIINQEIESRSLFKEFNLEDESTNNISTILPDEIDIKPLFDSIYQNNIMFTINNIEVKMDLIYLENLNTILNNEFGDYPKEILNYLLKNNIKNELFNFNSDQFNTSIFKFFQGTTIGEVSEIIDNYTLMGLVNQNMTNNFFNNNRLDSDDF